jgi:hypothetical protein
MGRQHWRIQKSFEEEDGVDGCSLVGNIGTERKKVDALLAKWVLHIPFR